MYVFTLLYGTRKLYFYVHTTLPLVILSQIIPLHTLLYYFFITHFGISLLFNLRPCLPRSSRDSSVGIATRYGLGGPGSNPDGGEVFHTRPDWF